MNAPILATHWPKARFTVAQIWALIEHGLMLEDARFELWDGEVIPMSPKGPLHEEASRLVMRWTRSLPDHLEVLPETTLYFDEASFVEPDYVVFQHSLAIKDLTPAHVLLAIEIGHDSWSRDIGAKAERYAAHGVQEYWAIHAPTRMIRVHRGPGPDGWADVTEIAAGQPIAPQCEPATALTL